VTRIIEYFDRSAKYSLRTGEVAYLQKDPSGNWGFETTAGYNEWEAPERLTPNRLAAYDRIKQYEKRAMAEKLREQPSPGGSGLQTKA
jgi:hypothetical protein